MDIEKKTKEKKRSIFAYLKSKVRYDLSAIPRPFIIEITGSPHAGKTTAINEIDKFLRRQGFRVLRPQEGGEAIRHIERKTPIYNIRTGLYALTQILDHGHGHNYDVVIFERGIFDAYCWMMYWAEKEKSNRHKLEVAKKFFLLNFWSNTIDRAYFMVCDPDKAMERELHTSLSQKLERDNLKMVKLYHKAYDRLSVNFPQIKLIDTTNLKEKEVIESITLDILDIMSSKTKKSLLKNSIKF